ncbi:MAG: aspartate aminotransferase family protein [Flavobacteriaceae bacterium]|nr:aspartate aminotransferase family protein [Flavobacteriaceae bacterium]
MLENFNNFQAKTTPNPLKLVIKSASGSYVTDFDNKKYLDFVAGISACTLGHRHPKIIKAVKDQLNKYLHVMVYGEFALKTTTDLAKEVINLLPKNHESIYFTNSGTEAIEGALKLVKRSTKRSKIIAAKNSYHGSTYGSLSLLGKKKQKKGYYPMMPNVRFIKFNSYTDINKIDIKTAGVILETIQGGAGFIIPKKGYLKRIKERCEKVGALLILDEIQPGFGRTGSFFAFEKHGISPDIIVMGKGMGGGLPIGAFSSSKKHMSLFQKNPKLGHITTFGGNPVIAASALATIKEIKDSKLLEKISDKEKLFRKYLIHKKIKKINGKGLMLALIFESKEIASRLIKESIKEGLLLFWLLWEKRAVRISPPLNIKNKEIKIGCKIIIKILDKI